MVLEKVLKEIFYSLKIKLLCIDNTKKKIITRTVWIRGYSYVPRIRTTNLGLLWTAHHIRRIEKKAERKMVVTPIWDRTWQTNEFVVLFVRRREVDVKGIISDWDDFITAVISSPFFPTFLLSDSTIFVHIHGRMVHSNTYIRFILLFLLITCNFAMPAGSYACLGGSCLTTMTRDH